MEAKQSKLNVNVLDVKKKVNSKFHSLEKKISPRHFVLISASAQPDFPHLRHLVVL